MRILCCGGRDWKDEKTIEARLKQYPPDTIIIEGECSGADKLSKKVAEKLGMTVIPFPAKWDEFNVKPCFIKYKNGKPYNALAGHIRNQQMLDEGKPDKIEAFHSNINESKGTKNMIERAKRKNIPIHLTEEEIK